MVEDAFILVESALYAADPRRTILNTLEKHEKTLIVHVDDDCNSELTFDLNAFGQIYILGAGKAAPGMALGMQDVLDDTLFSGHLIVPYGSNMHDVRIDYTEAGHPIPDENGFRATHSVLDRVGQLQKDDLLICLVSGGGSALLVHPAEGISLKDKQDAIKKLLTSGATIHELNTVRKHLSLVKGGMLAVSAWPATVITIILSDVIGNLLNIIASGPTSPDPSTFKEAYDVLLKYGIASGVSTSINEYINKGIQGIVQETSTEADRVFEKVHHVIGASNEKSVSAVAHTAEKIGYAVHRIDKPIEGFATDAGSDYYERFAHIVKKDAGDRPVCIVSGGETTVRVKGHGIGGRNQEMVLRFLKEAVANSLDHKKELIFMSFGTDGVDGPTDAAGAFITKNAIKQFNGKKELITEYLINNDSYRFFKKYGGLIQTGRTGTNVMDIQILLVG